MSDKNEKTDGGALKHVLGLGWIGVDLDGTLAHHEPSASLYPIGAPIPAMVQRVKAWLAQGREVRIVTARVAPDFSRTEQEEQDIRIAIADWCEEHLGARLLPITCEVDGDMLVHWGKCVEVVNNTGDTVVAAALRSVNSAWEQAIACCEQRALSAHFVKHRACLLSLADEIRMLATRNGMTLEKSKLIVPE